MHTYVVLLRGINVGGKNTISMKQLKTLLEENGFTDVLTYINSGNILLSSELTPKVIKNRIEDLLPTTFTLDSSLIKVHILSVSQLNAIIENAPERFGTEPTKYYCDVIFLMGVTTDAVYHVFSPREGVDRVWKGNGVIYSERLAAERTKSRLGKIIGTSEYKNMTIRSWNTTTKLLTLLEAQKEKEV